MAISFTKIGQKPAATAVAKRKPMQAVVPLVPLDQPGLLRVCHLMALLSVSRASVYARVADGRLPAADGRDGRPYWKTQTINAYLAGGAP